MKEHSWETYEPLIGSGKLSFDQIGTLHVCSSAEGISEVKATRDTVRALGRETCFLDSVDLESMSVTPAAESRVLSIPAECYLDSGETVAHFREQATARGVDICTDTGVIDVHVSDGAMTGVETDVGLVEADVVINAAGPSAPLVNEMVDISLPLRHNLGPILMLKRLSTFSFPNISFECGVYVRGEGDRQAFVGRSDRPFRDADVIDPKSVHDVNSAFYFEAENLLSKTIPMISNAELITEWVGIRTITPDGRPIVDSTAVDGFMVACGMSGHGVTLAPAIGQHVADSIAGTDLTLEAITPFRFDC